MERDGKGRFAKGNGGGPGRPPLEFSFTNLLRAKTAERPALIDRLVELAESADENVALRAIIAIANRLDGMPKQAVETNLSETDKAYLEHLEDIKAALHDGNS